MVLIIDVVRAHLQDNIRAEFLKEKILTLTAKANMRDKSRKKPKEAEAEVTKEEILFLSKLMKN